MHGRDAARWDDSVLQVFLSTRSSPVDHPGRRPRILYKMCPPARHKLVLLQIILD